METIRKEEVEFCDSTFFNDSEVHCYDLECADGHATGTKSDPEDNAPEQIEVTYPTLREVLADENMQVHILCYCGLYDLKAEDINYADIMLAYGMIKR